MPVLGGVDGCPAGWLCIRHNTDTGSISAQLYSSTIELFRDVAGFDTLTIDIPIGLTDAGARPCDSEARRLLGPVRASSVFRAPVRAALAANSWEEACQLSQDACGKRLSKQTYAIMGRIRDVDTVLRADPSLQERVREIHPEVCFYFWNGGQVMSDAKRTPAGYGQRRQLIEQHFGPVIDGIRTSMLRTAVADDDIVDAFAAVWTAARVYKSEATCLPSLPVKDRYGLRMEMLA